MIKNNLKIRRTEHQKGSEAMKFHPLSEVFPLIKGPEFDDLVASIRTNGLREPICIYDGMILDGRNRFLACQAAGVEPVFYEHEGNDEDAVQFVIDANIHRRHLDASIRAMAAQKLTTLGVGRPRDSEKPLINQDGDNCAHGRNLQPAVSQADAAKLMNVSRRSIQRAQSIVDKGSDELRQAVESGDVKVRAAAAVVNLPKNKQLAAVTGKKAPEREEDPPELDPKWEPDPAWQDQEDVAHMECNPPIFRRADK